MASTATVSFAVLEEVSGKAGALGFAGGAGALGFAGGAVLVVVGIATGEASARGSGPRILAAICFAISTGGAFTGIGAALNGGAVFGKKTAFPIGLTATVVTATVRGEASGGSAGAAFFGPDCPAKQGTIGISCGLGGKYQVLTRSPSLPGRV